MNIRRLEFMEKAQRWKVALFCLGREKIVEKSK